MVALITPPVAAPPPSMQASPSPSATPLREIGHVHSADFCSVLVARIRPAVAGVLANDRALDAGYHGLLAMAADVVPKAPSDRAAVQLDRMGHRSQHQRDDAQSAHLG